MKVYAQIDYISKKGSEYFGASYRDFVPERIEIKEVIKTHLRVVTDKAARIREVTRGILNLEAIVTQPIRTYIEHQLEAGIKRTPAYFALRERGLKVRKQTFLQYWHAIAEGWREEEVVVKEYDPATLTTIHEWLTKELQLGFGGFAVDADYDVNKSEEFTAPYKTRTFEFEVVKLSTQKAFAVERYYFISFNKNRTIDFEVWEGFDYSGFFREIRRIGAWH